VLNWIAQGTSDVVGVLEVTASRSNAFHGSNEIRGLHSIACLGVDRHRDIDASADAGRRGKHFVSGRPLVIVVAERSRHATASGRDDGKAGRDHGSRRGHVPGVRKQEGGAGAVQRAQHIAPALEVG